MIPMNFDLTFHPTRIILQGDYPPPPLPLQGWANPGLFSFLTDVQLEIDARIIVRCQQITDGEGVNNETDESLFPTRHRISLPLNGLNMLFEDINVSFNHHTKLNSDR